MGIPSFEQTEITHESKNMKLIAGLAAVAAAQQAGTPVNPLMPVMPAMPGMPAMNPLLMSMLFKDGSSSNDDLLMMMMMGGNMGQMNPLMLSTLFDSDDYASLKKVCDGLTEAIKKTKDMNKDDMSDLMLMMMLGGQGMGGDMNSMLPFLLMKDGGLKDNKNLMLMMMMQGQGNMMAGGMNPLLMMSLLE